MRESEYINHISINHRKDYGQYFTPSSVSKIMVQWILKNHPQTILDPAFGLGTFYDQVINYKPDQKYQFIAYEIDKIIIDYLNYQQKPNLIIHNCDYLETNVGKFDAIICNPPYMRFQKFLTRHDVLPKIEQQIGKKLVGYTNIASVFLIKALSELKDNGSLAFIMPFEFFNTGYGKEIKQSLLENNLLKQIIIFANEKEIFPDATTTVCILLCQQDGKKSPIKITQIKSNTELAEISDISNYYHQEIDSSSLPYHKKWTPILLSLFSDQVIPPGLVKLSFYGTFTRGIATGANDFFALNKSKIHEYNLDDHNLCKCITKSSQIRKAVFTEDDFNLLFNDDKPVYCLDVKDHENQQIQEYIALGERLEYHQRYLTKMRNPWYKIEYRQPSPILFGVFSRGRFKVIRNLTTAIHFTCYHGFYPNIWGENFVDRLFVYLLSNLGQEIIKSNKRSYGNSLDKFEPGDLNECFFPSISQLELMDKMKVQEIIKMANIDEELAVKMSDNLIYRILNLG